MWLLARLWGTNPIQQIISQALAVRRCRRQLGIRMPLCFVFLLLALSSRVAAQSGPYLTLSKAAAPTIVPPGGYVTYSITLTNSSHIAVEGITVCDTLPAGFAYRCGSSKVVVNGVAVSTANPSISGRTLTWSGLRVPPGRSDSFYGIHTFVQRRTESGYIDYQLNRSAELVGSGAYVTQLFDWIGTDWQGPQNWMRDFVSRAYDRSLTPVIRLAGGRGTHWIKPKPDADGSYKTWAQAFKRVVQGLPRRDGRWLYVQIWNEPNLDEEWEGQANPTEYGRFLVDTAAALRSIGDQRIVILNAPLSPGGDYYYLDYLEDMLTTVPASMWAFDVWASHPYPGNHPPEYNIHNSTARYSDATIDLYQRELEILARHGRSGIKVLLTETGYALFDGSFIFEGYSAINEANRADYIQRAFRDHWSKWPEVIGVCPYELVDPEEQWKEWDWLWNDGRSHQQYDAVKAMNKTYTPVSSVLHITFQAAAANAAGTYYNDVSAIANSATISPATQVAPITIYLPTPTRTNTPAVTQAPEHTQTATVTPMPTDTPATTETLTPTTTVTASPTPSATKAQIPTATTTPSLTPTVVATVLPTPNLTRTATATSTPSPPAGCSDLIIDGGFEWDDEAWHIPVTAYSAGYTTARAHSGQRSLRLGIDFGSDKPSYSTAWQDLYVPTNVQDPILAFWYYPRSSDTVRDLQYALILDEHGIILDWVLRVRSDAQVWMYKEYSLAPYRGKNIRISFGVYNDGNGDITVMYVDDVSVTLCRVQSTPSAIPSASLAQAFLPLVLRLPDEESEQYQAVSASLALAPALLSNVQTLWTVAEPAIAPDSVQSIALNPTNDLLYVAVGKAICVLQARTGKAITRISLDAAPRGLAVDVILNRIYVALWESDALAVIDGARNVLWKVVSGIPGASGVAEANDHIYVAATRSNELIIVDKPNCVIIKRVPVGDAPYAVVCDSGRQQIYVGNAGEDTVYIVDARSGDLLHTVRLGGWGHPQGLALDPIRDRLYVAYSLSPKYGAITVMKASSGQILSRLKGDEKRSLLGANGVAVDALRGWVYVTTAKEVLVLAGETLRIIKATPRAGLAHAFGLCVDPVGERFYIVDGQRVSLAMYNANE